jgi:hypothetical protein
LKVALNTINKTKPSQKHSYQFLQTQRMILRITHLYFKHVTIVLPKTWSVQNNYKKIAGSKFNKGHIRIDDENPVVGKVPYVFGQTECGQPGQYMHLTTYLLYAGSFADSRRLSHPVLK